MKLFYLFLMSIFYSNAFAFKIAVVSDFNSGYGSVTYLKSVDMAVEQLLIEKPDLILSTGDMIAGQKEGLDYLSMWDAFHQKVTLPLKRAGIAFAVTPGNHDGSGAFKFRLEREIFRAQWKIYKPELNFLNAQNYPDYYSFVFEDVLFVSIDATLSGKLGHEQMNWLKMTLTENTQYKHKIVFGHLPLFATVAKKAKETLAHKELENLFKLTKVTAYLSGHHHAFYPGKKEGIHHVSQGCLGGGPRKLIGTTSRSPRTYTLIDLDKKFHVKGINIENNFIEIDKKTLPESISYDNAILLRDDL